MINCLKGLKLAEFLRLNGDIVPYNVNICMPVYFIFFCLFDSWKVIILTISIFLTPLAIVCVRLRICIVSFLSSDNLPLHLESTLSKHLVFCISQINPDLSAIKNVIVTSCARYWRCLSCCRWLDGLNWGDLRTADSLRGLFWVSCLRGCRLSSLLLFIGGGCLSLFGIRIALALCSDQKLLLLLGKIVTIIISDRLYSRLISTVILCLDDGPVFVTLDSISTVCYQVTTHFLRLLYI